MTDVPSLKRHADLVERMSRAVGLDFEEEILRGNLQIDTLGDAVLRCSGCANTGACNHWLTAQDSTVEAPPDYCRNKDVFLALKNGRRV